MLDGIGLCFTDGTCQTYQSDYGNDGSRLTTYQLNQGDRLARVSGIWIRNEDWKIKRVVILPARRVPEEAGATR